VAPERMDNHDFMLAIQTVRPNLIVVDEAHTIAQWGDSFRPHYARLGDFIAKVKPDNILALTATCPEDVEAEIRRVLGLKGATKVVYYPKAPEPRPHQRSLRQRCRRPELRQRDPGLHHRLLLDHQETEEMLASLGHHVKGRGLIYNGSMTPDERSTNQSMFMNGDVRVMFATKAFGLGINKADIRAVCHRDIPGSIDDLLKRWAVPAVTVTRHGADSSLSPGPTTPRCGSSKPPTRIEPRSRASSRPSSVTWMRRNLQGHH